MIDHVNAVALAVHDVKNCAEFYRDMLGFQLKNLQEEFAYLTFGPKGSAGLALVAVHGLAAELLDHEKKLAADGLSRNYFAVFLEDTDREYNELRGKGVHFVTPPTTRPSGQRFAFFEDPEGNLWEISHFPKSQTGKSGQ
jgi:lactoylglutathione lyase